MTTPEEPPEQTSPLGEVDPHSLNYLFFADPLSLSNDDVGRIVDEVLAKRALWEKEEVEAKRTGRPRRSSVYKTPLPKGKLTLEMIGLSGKNVIPAGTEQEAEGKPKLFTDVSRIVDKKLVDSTKKDAADEH